jgi:hypothetical protein
MTYEVAKNVKVKKVTVPAATTVVNGEIVKLDGFIGVADLSAIGADTLTTGAAETKDIPIDISDDKVFRTNQIDTGDFDEPGQAIYWDASAKKITETVGQNEKIGKLTAVKDSDGYIEFMFLRATTSILLEKVEAYLKNHVVDGLTVAGGTTPSTHADASTFDFNADVAAGSVVVGGKLKTFAAAADFDVAHGATSPVASGSTKEIVYALVAKNVAGTITLVSVAGTAAASAAVRPTDAVIQAAVGAGNAWVLVGTFKIVATGAATCTEAADNDVKPVYSNA